MNYEQAKEMLSTVRSERAGKPYANNTRLFWRGEDIAMQLHATDIVTFHPNGHITLDSGGWRTVTTLERMRHAVNVLQVKGQWYIGGQLNEPRPEYPHRTIDKPFEALDPGPEPVKDPEGCIAGQSRTEPVEERHFIKRDELLDGEDFEDADSDYVWVTRPGEKTTYWGSERHRYEEERHSDIPVHTSTYEQCEHCRAFQARHDSWDEFMNGERWGRKPRRGYRQMVEYLERFGSREEWMRAYKEEGREVHAGQKAYREWEQRDRIEFFDGIRVNSNGRVVNPPRKRERTDYQRAVDKQKREIAAYVKLARETLVKGMPMPSGGDCWFCCLKGTEGGETWGDLRGDDHFHLREHIEEGYVVPSLITNAMLEAGYQPAGVYMLLDMDTDTETMGGHPSRDVSNSYDRGAYSTAMRALRKYLTKRLVPTNPKEAAHAR